MTRIIMRGCNGKMGQMISQLVGEDQGAQIVAGIDISAEQKNDYPVFTSLEACTVEADVIIDFASPQFLSDMLGFAIEKQKPIVLCTTGFSEEQIEQIKEASKKVAILKSANMSLGINLLLKMLKEAAGVLAPAGYDIEVVEKHHNLKIDAPSGTALALADTINEEFDNSYNYVYDRSQKREKRDAKEIGISAIRGGTIVGEHDVIFAGTDEVITFSHTAYSKSVFAKGAIEAAKFLNGKTAGLYDMSNVIDKAHN